MSVGVTVVILNWNGRKWLDKFLPFLLKTTYSPCEFMVVDNGSTDDSVAFVRERFSEVTVVELPENYGFAEGNNRAMKEIDTPYVVLLNSDVEVTPGWLEPLVAAMEAAPQLASVQPKIRSWSDREFFEYAGASGGFLDALGYPFCRGRVFDTLEKDEGQYDQNSSVFWATGACCLIRVSVIDQIGLFDPDFFAHMEEIDFCWRAKNWGYDIGCIPKSVVYHVGGGTLPQGNPRKTYLNVRNNLRMLYKNLPARSLVPRLAIRWVLDYIWGVKSLISGDFKTLGAIWKGHRDFLRSLSSLRRKRKLSFPKGVKKIPAQGYLPKSIIWQYFVKGNKNFSQIDFFKENKTL